MFVTCQLPWIALSSSLAAALFSFGLGTGGKAAARGTASASSNAHRQRVMTLLLPGSGLHALQGHAHVRLRKLALDLLRPVHLGRGVNQDELVAVHLVDALHT